MYLFFRSTLHQLWQMCRPCVGSDHVAVRRGYVPSLTSCSTGHCTWSNRPVRTVISEAAVQATAAGDGPATKLPEESGGPPASLVTGHSTWLMALLLKCKGMHRPSYTSCCRTIDWLLCRQRRQAVALLLKRKGDAEAEEQAILQQASVIETRRRQEAIAQRAAGAAFDDALC